MRTRTPRGRELGSVRRSGPQPTSVVEQLDSAEGHLVTGGERFAGGSGGERHRRAVAGDHPEHRFLHRKPGIDVPDGKDRTVVVAPTERVEVVGTTDATVTGDDAGIGMGRSPVAPRRHATVRCSRTMPASCNGPDTAAPVNVSNTDIVARSYITLFERDSSPEVRSTSWSTPAGMWSV